MKKTLLALLCLLGLYVNNYSQCAGAPDPACIGSSGPCGSLSNGIVGQPYSDTISFWAPNRVDASAASGGLFDSLDFVQFQIANVTGLPAGVTWSCYTGSCIYYPQPSGVLASLNVCGTPISAGTYSMHITIVGTVSTPIGNQSANQYFDVPLIVTNGSGGNSAFNFTPSQGCDSAVVNFNSLLNFPLPQITEWLWDFGGGDTYNGQTPPPKTYTSPGIYPVTCTTNVYNMVLSNLNVNVCGNCWWAGDIEEANCANGNADIQPTFGTGAATWTGGEVADNCNSNWTGIGFVFTGTSYSISLVENDVISADDHPAGPYTGTVSGPGTYGYNFPGNFSGNFTVTLALANQIIVTDTIIIYASPVNDTIEATATSFCPYDSVTLSVYPGMLYEWYLNDTVTVQTGFNHTYKTSDAGSYSVRIIDPVSGCYVDTDPITISTYPYLPPGFPNVGISDVNGVLTSAISGSYTYQWMYFNGFVYAPIPAPEGIAPTYTPQFNGMYCLIATNQYGCYDTSNCIGFYLGLEQNLDMVLNIYPNPTQDIINIVPAADGNQVVSITNMLGETIISKEVSMVAGSPFTLDLSAQPAGIYLLRIGNTTKRVIRR